MQAIVYVMRQGLVFYGGQKLSVYEHKLVIALCALSEFVKNNSYISNESTNHEKAKI